MPRNAFSIVEGLMATAVLAIVAAAAALPFAAGTQQIQEAAELEHAVALGEALMEEILARPFYQYDERTASPGPETGENSRELYNNVDDFDGFDESTDVLRNFETTAITDVTAAGFLRKASVSYVRLANQPADDRLAFVHVEVRVYHDGDLVVKLNRLVGRED